MSDQDKSPSPDETTRELVAGAARARARVAADVRELARELTPSELKERVLDAAERSVESIAARAVRRLAALPRSLVSSAVRHPVATGVLVVSAGALVWRVARKGRD
jgi:hypothetical protein